MTKNIKIRFAVFLLTIFAVEAALTLWPSVIVVTGHEGDMLHMLDMGLRMAEGEIPHVDFMTPLGVLSIAPVALFLGFGFGAAKSTILAGLLICLVLLPALWWVGVTRLNAVMRVLFGLFIIILLTATVYGGPILATTLSLFYNHWGWAIVMIVLVAITFPVRTPMAEKMVLPLVVGVGLAALALIKMTFFVALAPAVLLIFAAQKQFRLMGLSLLAGAVVAGIVAAILGVDFIFAYRDDLLTLAGEHALRGYPGMDLEGILTSPATLLTTVSLLGAVVILRKSDRATQGLILLILAPAFTYITYQNWGNDPKWLVFFIMYLVVSMPATDPKTMFGLPAREAMISLAAISFAVIAPSLINMATSPVRVFFSSTENAGLIPLPPALADIAIARSRLDGTLVVVNATGIPPYADQDAQTINQSAIPVCAIETGYFNIQVRMSAQLAQLPETLGKQVLLADALNLFWLLGDHTRVDNAAPWYYDDDSGFASADYFVVPTCPVKPSARASMVAQMIDTGWLLEPRFTSSLMTVYRINRTTQQ